MAKQQKTDVLFSWEGTDRKGRRMKGEMGAANEAGVRTSLRGQGIAVLRVRKKSTLFAFNKGKAITPKDVSILSRQLATMLEAGVPLVQSLEIIGRGDANPKMQTLVSSIRTEVESGTTLSEALSKHPKYFDDLFVNLVEAGERSGALESLLDKVATYQEKTEALKAKIKKALVYPASIVVVAFSVTAVLLVFVVPQFQELFRGFGADLPAFTLFVINLSEWTQSNWWLIALVLVAVFWAHKQGRMRSEKYVLITDKLLLRFPIVGAILVKSAIARYSRTLATMFAAGVPLVDALDSVAGATGNKVYENAVLKMKDEVSTGQPLHMSMTQAEVFTNLSIQMVAIGEESGSLDDMSSKVADFYEREVDDAVDSLTSLLEPLIISVIGVIVGGLIVAMYLPIFKLGAVVG